MTKEVVPFWEAFRFWLKLGFIGFGGPAGQFSIMYNELVENRKWISGERFFHALNYCMIFPGPEAQRLSVYLGWLMHGIKGGVIAGLFFIIPSMIIMSALSWLYLTYGSLDVVSAFLYGIKPAIVAVVVYAVLRIGQKAFKNRFSIILAISAFTGFYFLKLPFPLIILSAGLIGFIVSYLKPDIYARSGASETERASQPFETRSLIKKGLSKLIIAIIFWVTPFIVISFWFPSSNIFADIGLFFTKVALLSFGGAYAVLPYVAQNAVESYGWISPEQMIDSLALGELTPGPLIKIVAFVGFLGVWQTTDFGLLGALIGGILATYYVFLPSFFIVLIGAPINEVTRGITKLSAIMFSITAAVVGIILSLAIYFGSQVIILESTKIDLFALFTAIAAFFGLWRLRLNIVYAVLGGGLSGMIYKWALL